MEHARLVSRPRAFESARIARRATRDGQALPRRFGPVAAAGLLLPDLVTILVSEPRDGAGPFARENADDASRATKSGHPMLHGAFTNS